MSIGALFFFALFAAVMVAAYLGIRRQWLAPGIIAGGTVFAGIILMLLFSLAQGNSFIHALTVGLLLGTIFSIAVLAIAWYFQGNELREQYMQQGDYGASEEAGD